MSPKSNAADLDGSKEGEGVFSVPGGKISPALEMKGGIFNEVAEFVEMPVVFALDCAFFLGRNDGIHALFSDLLKDRIGIVSTIGKQVFRRDSLNQV